MSCSRIKRRGSWSLGAALLLTCIYSSPGHSGAYLLPNASYTGFWHRTHVYMPSIHFPFIPAIHWHRDSSFGFAAAGFSARCSSSLQSFTRPSPLGYPLHLSNSDHRLAAAGHVVRSYLCPLQCRTLHNVQTGHKGARSRVPCSP